MAKYKSKYYLDDFEVLKKIKWCFDRDIKFYPQVLPNQPTTFKHIPKVKIGYQMGEKKGVGKFEYSQGEELYDKIIELYIDKYEQSNKE